MASNSITAGKAFLRLLVDDAEFAKGLDKGIKTLDAFGKSAINVGASIGAAGAAIVAPFAASLKIFSDTGSALADMSARTGLSAEALSTLKFAAEQTGTSLDVVEKAARKLQQDGLDPNRIFDYAKQIAAIEDPVKRAQAAMDLFGSKAGAAILPLLTDLPALQQKAQELGLVWSEEMVQNADKFGDATAGLQAQLAQLAAVIGNAVAPTLTDLVENLQSGVASVLDWTKKNQSLAQVTLTLGLSLGAVGTAITGIGVAAKVAAAGIGYLRTALTLLAKHPWVIVISIAIAQLTTLLAPFIDDWLGLSDATDKATDSANKQAGAQRRVASAMTAGTKAIDDRAKAMANLTQNEQIWLRLSEQRAKGDAAAKQTDDLRVKAIDEQVRATQATRDALQSGIDEDLAGLGQLQRDRPEAGPNRARIIDESIAANEARRAERAKEILRLEAIISDLSAQRDKITGDDIKKREEAERQLAAAQAKQREAAEKAAREAQEAAEKLRKQQQEAAEAAQRAKDKQREFVVDSAKEIESQFDSFTREQRGGVGGKLAEQIGGPDAAAARAERQLTLTKAMVGSLDEIHTELQKGRVIVVGAI